MEEAVINDVDKRSMSQSSITRLNTLPPYHSIATKDVPDAHSLIKIHERIINEVSKLQQKWIQHRSRIVTTATTSKISTDKSVNERQQFRDIVVAHLPESITRRKKLVLFKRLHELRKHRMALTSKVKAIEKRRQSSTKLSFDHHYQQQQPPKSNEFDTIRRNDTTLLNVEGLDVVEPQNLRLMYDSDYQRRVWCHIRETRQMKCIQVAYRLTGISISMVPDDDGNETMKIQFDIGNRFTYECVFDIVHFATTAQNLKIVVGRWDENGSSIDYPRNPKTHVGQLFFRLVHHDLPSDIPITTIFQKVMMDHSCQYSTGQSNASTNANGTNLFIPIGFNISSLLLDPVQTTNHVPNTAEQQAFIQRLQRITQQIYHACHAYHLRDSVYTYLQHMEDDTNGSNTNSKYPYSIQQVQCAYVPQQSRTFKSIEFHIVHQLSSIDHIQVTLHFTTDLCRPKAHQPTSVNVKIISPSNCMDIAPYRKYKDDVNKKQTSWSSSVLQHLEGAVSDIDDDNNDDDLNNEQNHYEFIESTIRSFRTLPIQKALLTVTNAMTEY